MPVAAAMQLWFLATRLVSSGQPWVLSLQLHLGFKLQSSDTTQPQSAQPHAIADLGCTIGAPWLAQSVVTAVAPRHPTPPLKYSSAQPQSAQPHSVVGLGGAISESWQTLTVEAAAKPRHRARGFTCGSVQPTCSNKPSRS